jgi:hypothetical protein
MPPSPFCCNPVCCRPCLLQPCLLLGGRRLSFGHPKYPLPLLHIPSPSCARSPRCSSWVSRACGTSCQLYAAGALSAPGCPGAAACVTAPLGCATLNPARCPCSCPAAPASPLPPTPGCRPCLTPTRPPGPITISLMQTCKRDPRPLMMAQVLFSNVGGTATMVGAGAHPADTGGANLPNGLEGTRPYGPHPSVPQQPLKPRHTSQHTPARPLPRPYPPSPTPQVGDPPNIISEALGAASGRTACSPASINLLGRTKKRWANGHRLHASREERRITSAALHPTPRNPASQSARASRGTSALSTSSPTWRQVGCRLQTLEVGSH